MVDVRVGLTLPNRGVLFGATTPEQMLQMAEIADRSDLFQSVWVGDSLLGKPRMESIALLSGIAARTRRVRLGPACMASFTLRDPVLLAYQWASLDLLAEGRTILVTCTGIVPQAGGRIEGELYGLRPVDRVKRLTEWITLVKRLWTEDNVTFEGEHYRCQNITIEPKPARKPRPPIWIANNPPADQPELVKRTLRRTARHAEGWETSLWEPDDLALATRPAPRAADRGRARPGRVRDASLPQHQHQRGSRRRPRRSQALPGHLLHRRLHARVRRRLGRNRLARRMYRAPARLPRAGLRRGHAARRWLGPVRAAQSLDDRSSARAARLKDTAC